MNNILHNLRRNILISIFLLCSSVFTYAQFSADPYAVIYDDMDVWLAQGYISYLPDFRPLPEVVIAAAMREVMQKGDKESAKEAKRYLKKVNDFAIRTTTSAFGRINSITGDVDNRNGLYANGTLEASGSSRLNELISISAAFAGHAVAINDADGEEETYGEMRETYYLNKSFNRLEELELIRAGSFSNATIYGTFSSRSSFAIGRENLFLHAGFMRRSVGPIFDDGIYVSPQAPQSPNILVYWGNDKIAATWGLFSLSSSQEYITFDFDQTTGTETSDTETSTRNRLNKFYSYNTLTLRPSEKIEFTLFEGVMYGTFNLGYILPIKLIYSTDSLSDFAAGNLMSGASLRYRPFPTIMVPFAFVVDDISVSQYVRFNFYSKLKAAAEIAPQWNPKSSRIKQIKVGYQIVTPYTYTHVPIETNELYSTAYNTENFTHFDQHFATSLEPSSHRIYINSDFNINNYTTFGTVLRLEQHNNASEGILSGPLNDGSIVDDGYRSVYDSDNGSESATFQNRLDFLVGTVETKWEAGFNFGFYVPVARRINAFGDVNYTYRYIDNYNLEYLVVRQDGIFQLEVGLEFTHKARRK